MKRRIPGGGQRGDSTAHVGRFGPARCSCQLVAAAVPGCCIRWRRRVNPAWRVAAVEISNEPAVSALGVTAEPDGWGQLIVAVGDIHTAESFPTASGKCGSRSRVGGVPLAL